MAEPSPVGGRAPGGREPTPGASHPAAALRARIAQEGPAPWSAVLEAALYGPGGFYTRGGGAGRRRDFLTSPEIGPLFGAVVARAVDEAWHRWERPDPWVVVEGGAGAGALAAAVLAARPACAPVLRYVAVEASAPLRAAAVSRLSGLCAENGAVVVSDQLPVGPVAGVVVANELLDNLPFDVFRKGPDGWLEVRVAAVTGGWAEVDAAAPADVAAHLDALAPRAPVGGRVPWQSAAGRWLRAALALLDRGDVIVADYGRTTAELAADPAGWLRTYRRGGHGGDPLDHLGEQDITADVAYDQLGLVAPAPRVEHQGEWLDRHGLADLERAAIAAWRGRAAVGDLEALRARSRVGEAATLRDSGGLGGFRILTWQVGTPSRESAAPPGPA